jgi:hypothetical protein
MTNLLLIQIVRKIGNHNLGLGGDAILRGATLLLSTGTTGLGFLGSFVLGSSFGQRNGLPRNVGGHSSLGLAILL